MVNPPRFIELRTKSKSQALFWLEKFNIKHLCDYPAHKIRWSGKIIDRTILMIYDV